MFVPDCLLEELCQRLDKEGAGDWRRKLMQKEYGRLHLAVMAEPYLTRILQGEKTLESRLSRNRIPPYGRLDVGDVVLMKKPAGTLWRCLRPPPWSTSSWDSKWSLANCRRATTGAFAAARHFGRQNRTAGMQRS